MSKLDAPFRYLMRVRYGECDQQGVVYNPRYGDFVDLAGTEFLRAAIAPRDPFDGSTEYQVVKLLIEWKGPARFDDVLDISVFPSKIGTTSFTLDFAMRRFRADAVLVTAQSVMVHVDKATWAKSPLPEFLRAAIQTAARGQVVNHAGVGPI
jgi:acyl-CoA thioester hydrolase